MAIDDPLEALMRETDRWEMHPLPTRLWAIAKALAKHGSGYAFLADAIEAGIGDPGSTSRQRELLEGIATEVKRLRRNLDELSDQLRDRGFIEALITAADRTQRTVNMKKVHRFAVVLGRELASENPDWDEVQSFIRDISELGEKDIRALKVLHEAERLYGVQPSESRNTRAAHDEGFYTKRGLINDEDFYSRCGRLYGFGLALLNNETTLAMPQHNLFRISPRGNRLARLLQGTC